MLHPDPRHFGNLDPNQSGKVEPAPHRSEKQDPDPHRSEKQDPDPHRSGKVEALEVILDKQRVQICR